MALITCEKGGLCLGGRVVVDGAGPDGGAGEYLCIVGENGSGKSTLVKGLLGLITPVRGCVRYGDGLRRTEIGYLPQRTDVQNDFPASVWEVVTSGCRGRGPFLTRAMRQTAQENMALMDHCGHSGPQLHAPERADSNSVPCWRARCVPRAACCCWTNPWRVLIRWSHASYMR